MKIVILGSGNVATQLGKAFLGQGHDVAQVYSKTEANAQALASVLGSRATTLLAEVKTDADLYLLAVSDQAIAEIAEQLPAHLSGIVVHCSGATAIDVLQDFQRYGVVYPPQSLTKHGPVDLASIPFGIEGNTANTADQLMAFMRPISQASFPCSSPQRLALHTAAVFANNFANSLFQISYDILKENNLSFDLLRPIILETAQKVQAHEPRTVQTGPAQRGDLLTIEKHLQFISKNSNWVKIYQQLTEEITSKKAN